MSAVVCMSDKGVRLEPIIKKLAVLEVAMNEIGYEMKEYGLIFDNNQLIEKSDELLGARNIVLDWLLHLNHEQGKTFDYLKAHSDITKRIKDDILQNLNNFHKEFVKALLVSHMPHLDDEQFAYIYEGYLTSDFELINDKFYNLLDEYEDIKELEYGQ